MKNYFDYAVVTSILLLTTAQQAHAYIDPGSGSIAMTAILGFIAAIAYTSRKYFYRLKNLFKKNNAADPEKSKESNEE